MRWLDGIIDSMDMSLIKLEDGEGQGKLVYCSPWGLKESDTTEGLNKYFLAAPPLFLHSLPSWLSSFTYLLRYQFSSVQSHNGV